MAPLRHFCQERSRLPKVKEFGQRDGAGGGDNQWGAHPRGLGLEGANPPPQPTNRVFVGAEWGALLYECEESLTSQRVTNGREGRRAKGGGCDPSITSLSGRRLERGRSMNIIETGKVKHCVGAAFTWWAWLRRIRPTRGWSHAPPNPPFPQLEEENFVIQGFMCVFSSRRDTKSYGEPLMVHCVCASDIESLC